VKRPGVLAATLVAALCAVLPGETPAAEEPPPVHPVLRPAEEAGAVIEAVLQQPAFDRYREVEHWTFGDRDEPPQASSRWDLGLATILARVTEAALWGALLVAAVLAVVHRRRWLPWLGRSGRRQPPEAPAVLFGLDIRPESLPTDVPAEARRLWARGDARGALGLLYRGALASLVHRRGIAFAAGDTEAQCLAKVRPAADAGLAEHFRELTGAWQTAAYAHRAPDPGRVERLLQAWGEHFGDTP
jgi:hypothetical protein